MKTRILIRFASVFAVALSTAVFTGCQGEGVTSPASAADVPEVAAAQGAGLSMDEVARAVKIADCMGIQVPSRVREALNGENLVQNTERVVRWMTVFSNRINGSVSLGDQVRLTTFAMSEAPPPLRFLPVPEVVDLVEYGRSVTPSDFAGLPAAPILAQYPNETAFANDFVPWRKAAQEIIDQLGANPSEKLHDRYMDDVIQA